MAHAERPPTNRERTGPDRNSTPRGTGDRTRRNRTRNSSSRPQRRESTVQRPQSTRTPPRTVRRVSAGVNVTGSSLRNTPSGEDPTTTNYHELHRSIFPSIFGSTDIDVSDLRGIIRRLRRVQQSGHGRHRFHLLVESEHSENPLGGGSNPSRFEHVVTRVMFSPTISTEQMQESFQVHLLARTLNSISWRVEPQVLAGMMRAPNIGESACVTPVRRAIDFDGAHGTVRPPSDDVHRANMSVPRNGISDRAPLADESIAYWTRDLCDALVFPPWFPYDGSASTEISSEKLYISRNAVELFEFLEASQTVWIYRELFEFLHGEAKKIKIPGVPRMFKYGCFTPPWFRKQLVKGSEDDSLNLNPVHLERMLLPDLRNQRSRMGSKRIAYILGAFYQKEESMTKPALLHLLRIVPLNPLLQRKKKTPRKRGLSETRAACPEPALERSARTGNDSNVNNVRNSDETVQTIEDDDPRPTQRRRMARRLDEDVINLNDSRDERQEVPTPPRRGIPKMIFVGSEDEPEGRNRSEDRDLAEPNRQNARQTDTSSSSGEDEEDRIRNLFEEELEQERVTLQLQRANDERVHSMNGEEKEPAGDDDDDGGGDNIRPARPTQNNTYSIQHGNGSTNQVTAPQQQSSNTGQSLVFSGIVCAFGSSCRFRDSPNMQNSSRITGRCRVDTCRAIMHDLCGGGEFGDMICLACKERR